MTFFVQGLSGHEQMPLGKVFKEAIAEKVAAIVPEHAIDEKAHHGGAGKQSQQHDVAQAYQAVKELPQAQTVVLAEQIMSAPVVMLGTQATIDETLLLFHTRQFRHLPVASSSGMLVGIVSDRDIFRHLGGVMANFKQQAHHNRNEQVAPLMTSPVLTASRDTDVRYIARLFVEQRIGALPIVTNGALTGVITRSDVLNAVMSHYVLELWA